MNCKVCGKPTKSKERVFCSYACSNGSRFPPRAMPSCKFCGGPTKSKWWACCSRSCAQRLRARERILPPLERLLRHVDFGPASMGDPCWYWTGCVNPKGYAILKLTGVSGSQASRVAYRLFVGEIPDGLLVCHKCDNPPCVNPAHLFLGTDIENQADAIRKNRKASGTRNGRAKLTADQVAAIRRRYVPHSVSLKTVGREFGISSSQVYDIVKGNTWRHLLAGIGEGGVGASRLDATEPTKGEA